jgi:hypothetical protein
MKSLNSYINEGLADWGEDNTLNKKISKQTTKTVIKKEITDWIVNNANGRIYKNKLKFDFDTSPITIDYDGDIELKWKVDSLTNGLFQWGNVSKIFSCRGTRITSLEGAPKECEVFNCSGTDIESLDGCPENVYVFKCINCQKLKTLEGGPKNAKTFYCEHCSGLESLKGGPVSSNTFSCGWCENLKSLEGCPQDAQNVSCRDCVKLTSLKGCPKELSGDFDCSLTGIKNLKGGPIKAKHYDCHSCKNLISLEGGPESVMFHFNCYDCPGLKSLEGGPKYIDKMVGSLYDCAHTGIKNLKGGPEKIERFNCNGCENLESLEGGPSAITYRFELADCPKLKSLKHMALKDNYILMLHGTPIEDVSDLYKSNVKKIYFNGCPAQDLIMKYIDNK